MKQNPIFVVSISLSCNHINVINIGESQALFALLCNASSGANTKWSIFMLMMKLQVLIIILNEKKKNVPTFVRALALCIDENIRSLKRAH